MPCSPIRASEDPLSAGIVRAAINEAAEAKDLRCKPTLSRGLTADETRLVRAAWTTLGARAMRRSGAGGAIFILRCREGRYGGRFLILDGLPVVTVLDHPEKDVVRACLVHELTHAARYGLVGDTGRHDEAFYLLLERAYKACEIRKSVVLRIENHGVPQAWIDDRSWR